MGKISAAPSSQVVEITHHRRRRERRKVALRIRTGVAKSRDRGMNKKKKARELYKYLEPLALEAPPGARKSNAEE